MLGAILLIASVLVNIWLLRRNKRLKIDVRFLEGELEHCNQVKVNLENLVESYVSSGREAKDWFSREVMPELEQDEADYRAAMDDIRRDEDPLDFAKVHPMTFYKDEQGQWRWRIKARNGHIIGASTQGYVRRDDCEHNTLSIAASVREHDFRSDD